MTETLGGGIESIVLKNGAGLETYLVVDEGTGPGAVVWIKVESQKKDAR